MVIGDESEAVVQRRAAGTVRWTTKMLKQDFFERDPEHTIDIWLFKDKTSYESHTEALFGESPGTPYGYYSPRHKALIMNISTGGGTLVHEMVHPFMAANFPDCPAWFNEGLASLYEQSGEREGHIVGYTNWRLAGLKREIKADNLPSFEVLLATSERQFYEKDTADNYAQARYLCYWLQEKGLACDVLSELCREPGERPHGVQHTGCGAWTSGYEQVSARMGNLGDGAHLPLTPLAVGSTNAGVTPLGHTLLRVFVPTYSRSLGRQMNAMKSRPMRFVTP